MNDEPADSDHHGLALAQERDGHEPYQVSARVSFVVMKMPNYLFVTHDGDDHAIEIDLANDEVAYEEARKAFVEAARDALDENQEFTLRMTAEESSRPIFSAQFSFKIGRQG